jgi:segregation and condensation protein A
MTYKVKLEFFEGPLDLLLYLIKKNEIDIYNIPIAQISQQYLEYIGLMRSLDLNIAGEYLVMAATLMHIKSKMLLPPEEFEEEEEEEEDPRAELVRRLLEYQKFKQAAAHLEEREIKQKDVFTRQASKIKQYRDSKGEVYFEASVFDLISAFSEILEKVPKEKFQEVIKDEFTVSEKIHELLHMLMEKEKVYVSRLFKRAKSKLEIIAFFLAILELIRLKEIVVIQKRPFDEIQIRRNIEKIQPELRSTRG